MITLDGLRIEREETWTKLVVDIHSDKQSTPDKTMWFALPKRYESFFSDNSYDPFLLVSFYLGMILNEDVTVSGRVSKKLYRNLTEKIRTIFRSFSRYTHDTHIFVEGFVNINSEEGLIGASASCGVDSLCTIFDHFLNEKDSDYKINSLFLFNCGTNGRFENESSRNLWMKRYDLNRKVADELDLPLYIMDSNLHKFTDYIYESNEVIGYLALYSCVLCLQKVISKYYISSEFSYSQTLDNNSKCHDRDISEYAAPILVPLLSTESTEFILDTAQYTRVEKIEHIADWPVAQKYLNVCVKPKSDGKNCTVNCVKCRGTILVLESIYKTDKFRESFNVDEFYRNFRKVKIDTVARSHDDYLHSRLPVDFARKSGIKMPSFIIAFLLHLPKKIKWLINRNRKKKKNNQEKNYLISS